MAAWNPNVVQPDLRTLNGGAKFTASTPITADVINAIINALIHLGRREVPK